MQRDYITYLWHYLLIGGFCFTMASCDQHPQQATHQSPPQAESPTADAAKLENTLSLRFLATGETFYRELKLENGVFSYTHFDDKEKRCEQWVQSRPCWMEDDLTTVSKALSEQDIESLYATISNSGILDITESKLGGAKQGQRFYAQRLEIRMGPIEKIIIYQSFPGATPKPKPFQLMEDAMEKLVGKLPH